LREEQWCLGSGAERKLDLTFEPLDPATLLVAGRNGLGLGQ
jgi:hypothetical protein